MEVGIAEQATGRQRTMLLAFALAAAAATAAATINPIGYVGAGADDQQYLAAARCWVEAGMPCLPQSHWWTRWPAVAPVAAFTSLFGESRFSVGVGPALWWVLALVTTAWLGTKWFGWRAGAIAVALLGTTPIFAAEAFTPNADITELAFQLSSLAAATIAYCRQMRAAAFAAGLLAAIAVQTRETSLLFIGASLLVWLSLDAGRRRILLWSLPAFIIAEAAEMLVYAFAAGDPLLRLRLATGHTNIPSAELAPNFSSDRGPLLNPDYIKSWKRDAGVTLWWPIDPWLNLLLSPRSSLLVVCSLVSIAVLGSRLTPADRRRARALLGGAALVAVGLVYVLAIDPKPRMFMIGFAALSIAAAAAIAAALRTEAKPLALVLTAVPVLGGVHLMTQHPATVGVEAKSLQWIRTYGQDIELDRGAASYLTLLPEARALPPRGSGRRYLVNISAVACKEHIDHRSGRPNGRVVDQIAGRNPKQGYMCLFEYLPVRPSVAQH